MNLNSAECGTFELESERLSGPSRPEVPRRRVTSKRPVDTSSVGTNSSSNPVGTNVASNPSAANWDENNPNWTGSAWLPRNCRTEIPQKKSRSGMDTRRAKEPENKVDVDPSSAHDPVGDPSVDDVPPLNARLAARKPTPQEVQEHNVTHLPYRAWCETCVASRGVDDPHRRRPFENRMSEGEIDKVSFDFAFFSFSTSGSFSPDPCSSVQADWHAGSLCCPGPTGSQHAHDPVGHQNLERYGASWTRMLTV